MLGYMEQLYEEFGLDILVPHLGYKLRDKVKFKGESIDYDEMTKFVIHNKKVYPAFVAKHMNLCGTKHTIDGTAELIVGLATMLNRVCDMTTMPGCAIMEDLANVCELKLQDVLKYNRSSDNWYVGGDIVVDSLRLLRCSKFGQGFNMTKRFVSTLFALYKINRKAFFEVMLQTMQVGYTYIFLAAVDPTSEWYINDELPKIAGSYTYDEYKDRHFSKVVCSCGTTTLKLTEGQEVSIDLFYILTGYLYKTFAKGISRSNISYENAWDEHVFPELEKWFWNAVGTDRLGRYIKTGDSTYMTKISPYAPHSTTELDSIYELLDTEDITVFGNQVPKYIVENLACSIGGEVDMSKHLGAESPNTVNYFDAHALMDGLGVLLYYTDTETFDEQIIDTVVTDTGINEKTDELLEQIDALGVECSGTQRKLKAMTDKCNFLTEELEKAKKSHGYTLAKQQDKFDKLMSDYEKLKTQFASFFNDDSFEDLDDETEQVASVSIKEMIDYLKDYRIMIVGGHESRVRELTDSGLDIIWLRGQNELKGTAPNCDFILICTQFISHKVVYAMRKNYRDQADCIAYFNGVNYEAMLMTLYTKVKTWMEG